MKMGRGGESLNNRPLSRIIYIIFLNENIYFYMILSAHIFCRITMTNSKKNYKKNRGVGDARGLETTFIICYPPYHYVHSIEEMNICN